MSYKVVGSVKSRALRVLWLLEELDVPYEHIDAAPRSDTVKALSPSGKIPVLLDGDDVLTDSTAILTYLADRHDAWTYPAGSRERARQDAWTHRILDEVDTLLWTAARHSFILPEDQRVPAVKDSLRWEFERNITRMGDEMGAGPFLMGQIPTIADILLAHCAGWAVNARFPVEHGAIRGHMEMMRDRPAYQKAVAL